MILLKSKLLREQIKHWTALCALCAWAVSASLWGYAKREKIVLISIDNGQTRLVTDEKDKVLEAELTNFVVDFLKHNYNYSSQSYITQVGRATDFMSDSLFAEKQADILNVQKNLKNTELNQNIEIKSIDQTAEGMIEAKLLVAIKDRLKTHTVNLTVQMGYIKKERTQKNPYPFELGSLNEIVQ